MAISIYDRTNESANIRVRRILIACGALSSLFYIGMNIFIPSLYDGYNAASQTVSELSAIGAPTRRLWVILGMIYGLLAITFGWGVWVIAGDSKRLRVIAVLLIASAVVGLFWPPMHQRDVLAVGGGTTTDVFHIVFTAIVVPLQVLIIAFAARLFGKGFRIYSILSVVAMLLFGVLTGFEAPDMEKNLPTPLMGVWERIGMAAYMIWIVVFSILLLRMEREMSDHNKPAEKSY